MDSDPTNRIEIAPEGSGDRAGKYERLRSWYLAHLRKSQLVNDIASGVTPATLIKRDRAALELLIADSEPATSHETSNLSTSLEPVKRRKLKPSLLIMVVNVVAAIWLVTGIGNPVVGDFEPRLAIAILLVLSSIIIRNLIQDTRRNEVALNAVTHREQDIADYAYEAFWSVDTDLNFIAANSAFERLTGSVTYIFLGRSLLLSVPSEQREALKLYFERVKQSQKLEKFESQIIRVDGSIVDLELTAEYSSSDSSFYCVASDITERKEIDRLKEQLMAMLSHDLKTPLSSLQFSLALLSSSKYGTLNDEGKGLLKVGGNNVGRLISLINQLLDLHKLDAQQLKLSLEDVDVADIIQPALEAIESSAEQKKMDVTIHSEEVYVRADKDRMHQVLVNLLSNAIKYSPSGTEIVLAVKKLPGDFLVEFRVTDSGPGIPLEHRQRVFDRFYRIASTDGAHPDGTGLGLAISKAIVDAHRGKIDVENSPSGGSSFFCHIAAVKGKS